MPMRAAITALITLLACAPAHAKKPHDSRQLWATVNVCDTPSHPNEIGIRASMPGVKQRAKLRMRFRVQYFASADGRWHNMTGERADSGWLTVGRQRGGIAESGWNVRFKPPSGGGAHQLRGSVQFRWIRKGGTLHASRRITEAGHRSTKGSDPAGYSAATCLIS
jgi:hypothetical protein